MSNGTITAAAPSKDELIDAMDAQIQALHACVDCRQKLIEKARKAEKKDDFDAADEFFVLEGGFKLLQDRLTNISLRALGSGEFVAQVTVTLGQQTAAINDAVKANLRSAGHLEALNIVLTALNTLVTEIKSFIESQVIDDSETNNG